MNVAYSVHWSVSFWWQLMFNGRSMRSELARLLHMWMVQLFSPGELCPDNKMIQGSDFLSGFTPRLVTTSTRLTTPMWKRCVELLWMDLSSQFCKSLLPWKTCYHCEFWRLNGNVKSKKSWFLCHSQKSSFLIICSPNMLFWYGYLSVKARRSDFYILISSSFPYPHYL